MRSVGSALKLGVELASDKPRMLRDFNHFDNVIVGRCAGKNHTAVEKVLTIIVVNLISVTMTLINHRRAVKFV